MPAWGIAPITPKKGPKGQPIESVKKMPRRTLYAAIC